MSILHKVKRIDALEIFVVTIPNEVISIFILKAISSGSKRGISYLQYDIIFAVGSSIFTLNTKLIARRDAEFVTTPEEDIDRGFIIFETTYTDNEFTCCHAPIFIELAGKIGKIGCFKKVGKLGQFVQAIAEVVREIFIYITFNDEIQEFTGKSVRVFNRINTGNIILPIGTKVENNRKSALESIGRFLLLIFRV